MLCKKAIPAVLCFFLPAITFAQIAAPKQAVLADKIIAVVGDRMILSSEIKNSINDLVRQNIALPPGVECLVTEQAIVSKLLALQALKDSLPVTDEEVEAELDSRLSYMQRAGSELDDVSINKLKNDLRGPLKERRLAEAMQQKITGNIAITPAEVKTYFDKIPHDSLPFIGSEMEVGQIVSYPSASKDLEQYVVNELNNYKKQVEDKAISFCQLAKIADNNDACSEQAINRNNDQLDAAFIAAAFRLKKGGLSAPVKCKYGFYLIQMIERKGDDATVRYIFRPHPVTDVEINQARVDLNELRSAIMEGKIGFNEAAARYSRDDHFSSPFFLNQEGSTFITVGQLEKDVADVVNKMSAGDISRPMFFVDEQNKKAVRIIFLKSRSLPHRMNLRDDYTKISKAALEEKKNQVLAKWLKTKISAYYIMIDGETTSNCPALKEYETANAR